MQKVVKTPTPATLRKYGLTMEDWFAILERQGGVCAICKKYPKSGRLCIDHDHVPGWKHLEPDERREHVRGLLCWVDNHYAVGRGVTLEKARNVVAYLEGYAKSWEALRRVNGPPPARTTKTRRASLSLVHGGKL